MTTESSYSCAICCISFQHLDDLKGHHKTQWHRYNMKRKLAGFPEVQEDEFKKKLSLLKDRPKMNEKGTQHLKRSLCVTSLSNNEKASVAKHSIVKQLEPLTSLDSFFDTKHFSTIQENLQYMEKTYSLFIPNKTQVKNLADLLTYLAHKLYYGHQCLFCNRPFKTLSSVRKHMIDKGHTSIGIETEEQEEELEPFYEYHTPLQSECEEPESQVYSENHSWETSTDMSELDDTGTEIFRLKNMGHSRNSRRPYVNEMGNLVLPNGKEVPHRAVAYIYRQRLAHYSRDTALRMILLQEKQKHSSIQLNLRRWNQLEKITMHHNNTQNRNRLRQQLCFGIKNNRLQKTIRRQDKYFL